MELIKALPLIYKFAILSVFIYGIWRSPIGEILHDSAEDEAGWLSLGAVGIILLGAIVVACSCIGSVGYFTYQMFWG